MCMWFECPKMDNGMTHIENWVHRSRQRISFVTQMDGLIDALLTENNMSILELFDSNMVVKDTSIKTVPEKLKACQKKGWEGLWKMRDRNFLISQDEFHANGRDHSFRRCAQISICIQIICCVASCFHRSSKYMGVSKNRGTPKWMVFIMENPIKNGWFGGKTHFFRKHPYMAIPNPTHRKNNISPPRLPPPKPGKTTCAPPVAETSCKGSGTRNVAWKFSGFRSGRCLEGKWAPTWMSRWEVRING